MTEWKTLGRVSTDELIDARLQQHHAAQIVASAGITFLESQPDDSHPNFAWDEALQAFVGRELPVSKARIGLRIGDLTLFVVDKAGRCGDEFVLDGEKLATAYAWLAAATESAGEVISSNGMARSEYALPSHPVETGEVFSAAPTRNFQELACWSANGHMVLNEIAEDLPGASGVRCWPHHFDQALLVSVATDDNGQVTKSIGVGLSPGDESYAEPYWYVSPWPYPGASSLPTLESNGHWHTEGYTAAILTGTNLVSGPSDSQAARLRTFLLSSIDACRNALAD